MDDEIWILVHHSGGKRVWRCGRDRTMFRAIVDALSDTWKLGHYADVVELTPGDYSLFAQERGEWFRKRARTDYLGDDELMFMGPSGLVTVRMSE